MELKGRVHFYKEPRIQILVDHTSTVCWNWVQKVELTKIAILLDRLTQIKNKILWYHRALWQCQRLNSLWMAKQCTKSVAIVKTKSAIILRATWPFNSFKNGCFNKMCVAVKDMTWLIVCSIVLREVAFIHTVRQIPDAVFRSPMALLFGRLILPTVPWPHYKLTTNNRYAFYPITFTLDGST